jgi:hypothetical protein
VYVTTDKNRKVRSDIEFGRLYIKPKLFGELCVSPVATQLLPLALGIEEEDNTREGECAVNSLSPTFHAQTATITAASILFPTQPN